MKVKMNFKDALENNAIVNNLLEKRGLAKIVGGACACRAIEDYEPFDGGYSNIAYPDTTYVRK